eukprot:766222-Hanusia_phi.AAC.5
MGRITAWIPSKEGRNAQEECSLSSFPVYEGRRLDVREEGEDGLSQQRHRSLLVHELGSKDYIKRHVCLRSFLFPPQNPSADKFILRERCVMSTATFD